MVRALHAAGLEVILDVVFNHTAEGSESGAHAVLPRHRQRRLLPTAGRPLATTSTTPAAATRVDLHIRTALRLVMDALRYWVPGDARRRFSLRPGGQPRPRR